MEINTDYIRGFADADGGWVDHIVVLNNTDLGLLERIRECLQTTGIETHLDIVDQDDYLPIGRLKIHGLSNLVRYAIYVGFAMKRKQRPLEGYIRYVSRPRRPYNPDDYDKYLEMKAAGISYRKMAQALNLSPSTIDRREKRGTYPLDEETLELVRQIRDKS